MPYSDTYDAESSQRELDRLMGDLASPPMERASYEMDPVEDEPLGEIEKIEAQIGLPPPKPSRPDPQLHSQLESPDSPPGILSVAGDITSRLFSAGSLMHAIPGVSKGRSILNLSTLGKTVYEGVMAETPQILGGIVEGAAMVDWGESAANASPAARGAIAALDKKQNVDQGVDGLLVDIADSLRLVSNDDYLDRTRAKSGGAMWFGDGARVDEVAHTWAAIASAQIPRYVTAWMGGKVGGKAGLLLSLPVAAATAGPDPTDLALVGVAKSAGSAAGSMATLISEEGGRFGHAARQYGIPMEVYQDQQKKYAVGAGIMEYVDYAIAMSAKVPGLSKAASRIKGNLGARALAELVGVGLEGGQEVGQDMLYRKMMESVFDDMEERARKDGIDWQRPDLGEDDLLRSFAAGAVISSGTRAVTQTAAAAQRARKGEGSDRQDSDQETDVPIGDDPAVFGPQQMRPVIHNGERRYVAQEADEDGVMVLTDEPVVSSETVYETVNQEEVMEDEQVEAAAGEVIAEQLRQSAAEQQAIDQQAERQRVKVEEALSPAVEASESAPTLRVVATEADLQAERPAIYRKRAEMDGSVPAMYDPQTDTTYIVADMVKDPADAVALYMHESGLHGGIRRAFGTGIDGVLDSVSKTLPDATFERLADAYGVRPEDRGSPAAKRYLAEEYLAEIAERVTVNEDGSPNYSALDNVERSIWQRMMDWVRGWLKKSGSPPVPETRIAEIVKDSINATYRRPGVDGSQGEGYSDTYGQATGQSDAGPRFAARGPEEGTGGRESEDPGRDRQRPAGEGEGGGQGQGGPRQAPWRRSDGRADVDSFDAGRSQQTASFFSERTSGLAGVPDLERGGDFHVVERSPAVREFGKVRDKYTGNFDLHIATSIPGFYDVQEIVGLAIQRTLKTDGGSVLDIGASEGAMLKAVAEGQENISAVALDPNPDMRRTFREKGLVPNVEFVRRAFSDRASEGKEMYRDKDSQKREYIAHGWVPDQTFDIVHEAMAFQFISNKRAAHLSRAKELLNPDGILITEQKVFREDWRDNESSKNAHKRRFFDEETLKKKDEEILVGMEESMVPQAELERALTEQFEHVEQIWSSGNFAGYAASDSRDQLDAFIDNLESTESEFSVDRTPREVVPGEDFDARAEAEFNAARRDVMGAVRPEESPRMAVRDQDGVRPTVSAENAPGANSGVLSAILAAPPEIRQEFHRKISDAMRDPESGQDLIGQVMREAGYDVTPRVDVTSVSAYINSRGELELNPADQVSGFKDQRTAEVYALLRGYLTYQEAVAGYGPDPGGSKAGFAYDLGAAPDIEQLQTIFGAITAELEAHGIENAEGDFAFYPAATGFHLIHLGFDNRIDANILAQVMESVALATGAADGSEFTTDTFYHTNNWEESHNGEEYQGQFQVQEGEAGRSDLFARVDRRLRQRLQAVYDEFSQRGYGDASPGFAVRPEAEVDRRGTGPDGSVRPRAEAEADAGTEGEGGGDGQGAGRYDREGGGGSPGAEPSAPESPIPPGQRRIIYHWSKAPGLAQTDPSFHGTGKPGAESSRKDSEHWVDRTYFGGDRYGQRPERGLGDHIYRTELDFSRIVDLDNLTDAQVDIQKAATDVTHFERLLMEAGYDGVYREGADVYAMFTPMPVSRFGQVGDQIPLDAELAESYIDHDAEWDEWFIRSPYFKEWFGDWEKTRRFHGRAAIPSQIVDTDGKPLLVYHGTQNQFWEFYDPETAQNSTDRGWFGAGSYFTPDEEVAVNYSATSEGPGRVIPAYISMRQPFHLNLNDSKLEITQGAAAEVVEKKLLDLRELQTYKDSTEEPEITGIKPLTLTRILRRRGYDGVLMKSSPGEPGYFPGHEAEEIVIFSPHQAKASDNFGTFSDHNNDIRYSIRRDLYATDRPVFYSAVKRGLRDVRNKLGSDAKVKGRSLLNMIRKQPHVTEEELEWSGLGDLLDTDGKVDPAEAIEQHEQALILRLQEVVLSEDQESEYDEYLDEMSPDEVKYADITLPGGTNYREVLLTADPAESAGIDFTEKGSAIKARDARREAGTEMFTSDHFDEVNIIAHMRINDRQDDAGHRVLFLEEVQSDWHQEGREKGYREDTLRYGVKNLRSGYESISFATREEAEFFHGNLPEGLQAETRVVERLIMGEGPPPAPWKDNWHVLALRRAVQMAAADGYDTIAWTTGQQQSDRYDLSRHIGSIELHRSSGGVGVPPAGPFKSGMLVAYSPKGERVLHKRVESPEELASLVGKDAAEKAMAAPEEVGTFAGMGARIRRLDALDVRVGGEGMAEFYDNRLPSAAKKIAKKYRARVGQMSLPGVEGEVHAMTITDKMRKSAEEAMFPLFKVRGQERTAIGMLADISEPLRSFAKKWSSWGWSVGDVPKWFNQDLQRWHGSMLANTSHVKQRLKRLNRVTKPLSMDIRRQLASVLQGTMDPQYVSGADTARVAEAIDMVQELRVELDRHSTNIAISGTMDYLASLENMSPNEYRSLKNLLLNDQEAYLEQVSEMMAEDGLDTSQLTSPELGLAILRNRGGYTVRAYARYLDPKWMPPQKVQQVARDYVASTIQDRLDRAGSSIEKALGKYKQANLREDLWEYARTRNRQHLDGKSDTWKDHARRLRALVEGITSEFGDDLQVGPDGQLLMDPQRILDIASGTIDYMLTNDADKGLSHALSSGGPTSLAQVRDNLKRRKEIPKPIRDLYGEIRDLSALYQITSLKQRQLLVADKMQREMLDHNDKLPDSHPDKAFFLNPPSGQGAGKVHKIPESPRYGLLAGRYVNSQVREMLDRGDREVSGWAKAILLPMYAFRYSKTILNVPTHARNTLSNLYFMAADGELLRASTPGNMMRAAKAMWKQGDEFERLLANTTISSGITSGEFVDTLQEAGMSLYEFTTPTRFRRGIQRLVKRPVRNVADVLAAAYAFEDNVFKAAAFYNKTDRGIPDAEAVERIRENYPNYDMVPRVIRDVARRVPFMPDFLSFKAEAIRNQLNSLSHAVKDARQGDFHAAIGSSLAITGSTSLLGLTSYAVARAIGSAVGDDDEPDIVRPGTPEEGAVRTLLPDYQKMSQIVAWRDGDRIQYMDLGYIAPYDMTSKISVAMTSDLPPEVRNRRFYKALEGEFIGWPMATQWLIGIAGGTIGDQRRSIYQADDDYMERASAAIGYTARELQPSMLYYAYKALQAQEAGGELTNPSTGEVVSAHQMAAQTALPIRVYTVDPKTMLTSRAREVARVLRDRKSTVSWNRRMAEQGAIPRSTYQKELKIAQEKIPEVSERDLGALVLAGRSLGMLDDTISQALRDGGIAKRDVEELLSTGRITYGE